MQIVAHTLRSSRIRKTTSFILGDRFDQFISGQVQSGRYATSSEVIREGLRLVEERAKAIEELNRELDAGLASGIDPDFSWDAIKAQTFGLPPPCGPA
jgi:antitoxin ParD1/3/4